MNEINNIYSINELLRYKENVLSCINEGKDEQVLNDSAMHASIIMTALLQTSQIMEIYCGKFSIFRNDFKEKINQMLKSSFYNNIRKTKEFQDFTPYQDSLKALDYFLSQKDHKLTVIVDEDIESVKEDSELMSIISGKKNINFYRRHNSSDELPHFTVASKDGINFSMYRNEMSKERRTAICNFGSPSLGDSFHKCYDILILDSQKLDIK